MSFPTVAGRGFVDLAQDLINVGATYGCVSAERVLPDPTTISWRCNEDVKTSDCGQINIGYYA